MLRRTREIEIAELAESIADYYFPSTFINPGAIAIANSITYDFDNYESYFDGMLQYHGGKFHIFLDLDKLQSHHSPRARFTLAHELGHFYIDEHRNALKSGRVKPHTSMVEIYSNNNLAEMEADCFASNLLMPRRRFQEKFLKNKQRGLAAILQLADGFQVSILGSAVNYIKRDLSQSILVKWGPKGYEWSMQSMSFINLFSKKLYINFYSQRDTATYLAQNQAEQFSSDFHRSTSTLSLWSNSIFPSGKDNYFLNEEAIKLGGYGGLTLLTVLK